MLTRTRARRGGQQENGAAALMIALTVTVLCGVAAFAIDLGLLRYTKADNKAAADIAAAAGIRGVAAADGKPRPYQGVCDALAVLRANHPGLRGLSPDWTGGICQDPSYLGRVCEPDLPSTWARYYGSTADGTETWIESGYDLNADATFADAESELGGTDTGAPLQGGCDQLAVIIKQPQSPIFAGFVGQQGPTHTLVRSVARVDTGTDSVAAVSLLLLERRGCLALEAQGTGIKAIVYGAEGRPGLVHADSLGDAADCSSSNAVIDGGSQDALVAKAAETGNPVAPGQVSVAGLVSNPSSTTAYDSTTNILICNQHTTTETCTAPSPRLAPVGRPLVGRAPFDKFYEQAVKTHVALADQQWNLTAADAGNVGYTVVGGSSTACGSNPAPADTSALMVFVDCPGGATYNSSSLPTFTGNTWVFNGPVKVTGNLHLPNATRVYLKGTASTSTAGLEVSGSFRMNGGGGGQDCGTIMRPRAQLIIGSGPLLGSGSSTAMLRMCHTSVLMASQATATSCPIGGAADDVPVSNSCRGHVSVTGQISVDWSAPDSVDAERSRTDLAQLEDLALWTEASGTDTRTNYNRLEGLGRLGLSGVFFTPNASPFRIAGNGTLDNLLKAQFATRRLQLGGNGRLHMKPDPNDVVSIPFFGSSQLVR